MFVVKRANSQLLGDSTACVELRVRGVFPVLQRLAMTVLKLFDPELEGRVRYREEKKFPFVDDWTSQPRSRICGTLLNPCCWRGGQLGRHDYPIKKLAKLKRCQDLLFQYFQGQVGWRSAGFGEAEGTT